MIRLLPLFILLFLGSAPAAAHGPHGHLAPEEVLGVWHPNLWLTTVLIGLGAAYAIGRRRLHRRAGRIVLPHRQAAACWAGLLCLWIALASPLEAVTGTLLTAHMLQHVILIAVAPPLLLAGRPGLAAAGLISDSVRRRLVPLRLTRLASRIARPVPAALIHAAALWLWHAPPLFQAAMTSEPLHHVEHASFLLTALLFWHAIYCAVRSPRRRLEGATAIVVTLIQGGLLGALLTLANRPLFQTHLEAALDWGLTPLEDQQLAGLLMWVPAGGTYLLAGIVLARRLVAGAPTRGVHA